MRSKTLNQVHKPEGIDFEGFYSRVKNKYVNKARTILLKPQGKAKCNSCKHLFEIKDHLSNCPKCNSYNTIVISGKELRVRTFLTE